MKLDIKLRIQKIIAKLQFEDQKTKFKAKSQSKVSQIRDKDSENDLEKYKVMAR